MSSLAGALDPVGPEPKNEPLLDDVQGMFADEGTPGNKEQDEEMQDLFGEADENVEEIKHNEYVYCIVHCAPQFSGLTVGPPEAPRRLPQHRPSMQTLWMASQPRSVDIEKRWSMLRKRKRSSQPNRYSLRRPLRYRTSQCPGARMRTCVMVYLV